MRIGVFLSFLLALSAAHAGGVDRSPRSASLADTWQRIRARLKVLVESKRLVPPVPVAVKFSPRKIWSGTVDDEVLALRGVDLGEDGQSELVVLTGHQLLLIRHHRGLFDIRLRKELPYHPPAVRPRQAIGTIAVSKQADGVQVLRVRSSLQSRGSVWNWNNDDLHVQGIFRGYPVCEQGIVKLVTGRNYFSLANAEWEKADATDLLSDRFWAADCATTPSPTGRATEYLSSVDVAGVFRIRCKGELAQCKQVDRELEGFGYAYEVVDVNNDGFPEIVSTSNALIPSNDRLTVYSTEMGATKILFEKDFGASILGITSGDFDGDGSKDIISLVRDGSAGKVSLWLLN